MHKKKRFTTKEYAYTVLYEPVKEGGYQVTVPLLPNLITYGRTLEEARKMARDAIVCYLESLQKDREELPTESALLHERMVIHSKLLAHA